VVYPPLWALACLADIANVQLGKTPGKADYKDAGSCKIVKYRDLGDDGEITWTNAEKGFIEHTRAEALNLRRLADGDVLISASAHSSEIIGRKVIHVRQLPNRFDSVYYVGEILCIRIAQRETPHLAKLVMYFFRSANGYKSIQSKVHGVHLIASRAEKIAVPIPPKETQARIVSKIDELFSRIGEGERALKRVKKLVARYRQSVLKAAITGELTREWRAKRKGQLGSGNALLQSILKARREAWEMAELDRMKAKGFRPVNDHWKKKYQEPSPPDIMHLAELPEGWVWTSMGQLFPVSVGSTPSRKEATYWNGGIPWVSSGEVAFCRIKDTKEHISPLGFENSSVRMHPPGTVLLAMIGEGKTRGQAAILDIEACHNQNAASIGVSATPIPPEYIFNFLKYRYERV
jgi:type I restriction enzyme S subunit